MTEQARSDIWKLFQILSPIVSIVVFIVYMQASLQATIKEVEELKSNSHNVGQILTAHTTQLAINQNDIATNKLAYVRIQNGIDKLNDKLDEIYKRQSKP